MDRLVHSLPVAQTALLAPIVHRVSTPRLSIVVPCYNEEEVLPETLKRLRTFVDRLTSSGKIAADSQIVLVDDGSRDQTWSLIRQCHAEDPRVRGVKLSGNRGHQTALIAGLFAADADAIVSIDADLQDDISAIEAMLDAYQEGCEVVYGARAKRQKDSIFKRSSAETYYRLLAMLGVRVVHDRPRLPSAQSPRAGGPQAVLRGQSVSARHRAADRLPLYDRVLRSR